MNRLQLAGKILTTRSTVVDFVGGLFGSIASNKFPYNRGKDFIPLDGNGKTLMKGDGEVNPRWLGLESKDMQYWAYRYCSPLAAVVDRIAEADTNGKIKFLDNDGNIVKNVNYSSKLKKIAKLFKRPNPFQTWEEFNAQQMVICKIFGYCPVFAFRASRLDPTDIKYLFNLNPFFFTPDVDTEYDPLDFTNERSGRIKNWNGTILGSRVEIDAQDVFVIKDGYVELDSNGLPLSKIAGMDYFISNICAAMEADNVLLKKKGPLGVFSYEAKPDPAGITPMTPDGKDDLQQDLSQYGLSWQQLQYVVSKWPVKWNAMSFNLRDLMTKETVRQGIDGICDRLGYPAELMSGKNATYENRSSAEKYFYQNNVIPFSLRKMATYNQFFGMEDYQIVMDYSHLVVLQEDTLKSAQAAQAETLALDTQWKGGLITYNEYRLALDMETKGTEFDIYYNEYLKKFPAPVVKKEKIKTNVKASA